MIFITAAFFYLLRGFFLFIRRKLKSLGSLVCYPPPPPPVWAQFLQPEFDFCVTLMPPYDISLHGR